jgi:hypothetical protein
MLLFLEPLVTLLGGPGSLFLIDATLRPISRQWVPASRSAHDFDRETGATPHHASLTETLARQETDTQLGLHLHHDAFVTTDLRVLERAIAPRLDQRWLVRHCIKWSTECDPDDAEHDSVTSDIHLAFSGSSTRASNHFSKSRLAAK